MSVNRGVVKYMALPNNGITAAVKKKKNDNTLMSGYKEIHLSRSTKA